MPNQWKHLDRLLWAAAGLVAGYCTATGTAPSTLPGALATVQAAPPQVVPAAATSSNASTAPADERQAVPALAAGGRVVAEGGLQLPGFSIEPGGVLYWKDRLRVGYGGGEASALPPINGLTRAQPGGNLILQPQGDSIRSAIDLLPATGTPVDLDAICEFTLHRRHPTADTQEMLSLSALGQKQGVYGMVIEAHGQGVLRPLVFMTVQGGLRNPAEAFSAEALRITEDGTVALGVQRQNGRLKRPVESLTLEQPEPPQAGQFDSDFVKWVGKSREGDQVHRAEWRAHVRVDSPQADSRFSLQTRTDSADYQPRLEVTSQGDLELNQPKAGLVMHSPNGTAWRVSVTNDGELRVLPAE